MFVTCDRDSRGIICFIGDSYANCGWGTVGWQEQRSWAQQTCGSMIKYPVYTDMVSDRMNLRPLVLGCGSASWWQSRDIVLHFFEQFPQERPLIKYLVAMHSDSHRINSVNCGDATDKKFRACDWFDAEYQEWSQRQWFRELATEVFPDVPSVHFSCFGWQTESQNNSHDYDCLQGTIFLDPLIYVTVGEFTGTKNQVDTALRNSSDSTKNTLPHHNHMNASNHLALTDVIVETLQNLTVRTLKPLPLQRFDIANINCTAWPDGQYWTDQR